MRTHHCSHGISFLQPCARCMNAVIAKTQEQTINEAAFDAAMKRVEDLRIARLEKTTQQQWEWFRGFASVLSYRGSDT
jgi:hypothetical protein